MGICNKLWYHCVVLTCCFVLQKHFCSLSKLGTNAKTISIIFDVSNVYVWSTENNNAFFFILALILSCHRNVSHKTNAAKRKSHMHQPELCFLLSPINTERYCIWDLKKYNGKGANKFYGTTIKDQTIKRHLKTQKQLLHSLGQ